MTIVSFTREELKKIPSKSDWESALSIPDDKLDTSDFDIDKAVLVYPENKTVKTKQFLDSVK